MSKAGEGFLDYTTTGEITNQFIEDYYRLTAKIYSYWSLTMPYEDFRDFCVEKLVNRISNFDPAKGLIGTFVYNIILNEARRIHSKEKHEATLEIEVADETEYKANTRVYEALTYFVEDAKRKGITISYDRTLAGYQLQEKEPYARAFTWLLGKGRL